MKTVLVVFGGRSTEHDVSIITAISSIIKPLQLTKKYNIEAVYIKKDGTWLWDNKLKDIKTYQSGDIDDMSVKNYGVQLSLDGGLTLHRPSKVAGKSKNKKIDLVFPATHGTHGEDGELMGILQMANVPFVGCDMASSAVAMDKVLSKQVTSSDGIPSTPWMWFHSAEYADDPKAVVAEVEKLKYPLFVKPAHLGSSIGITRVKDASELTNALEVAVHYDKKVIVEEEVSNLIEVTLPIMGNADPVPALLEQPLTESGEFFDFDEKYLKEGGKKAGGKKQQQGAQGYSKIPADISDSLTKKAMKLGIDTYLSVGCSGIARIDMLIDGKTEKVYFNEINPLPGSLYSHNWKKAGVSNIELVEKLIDYAQDKWQAEQKYTTSFKTNYLKKF